MASDALELVHNILAKLHVVVLSRRIWVEVANVRAVANWVDVASVQTVLDLHAGVPANIDVVSPIGVLGEIVLHSHIHVEGLVSLRLAVLNALNFALVLRGCEVKINAVFVALFEEKFWQSILLGLLVVIVGVAAPSGFLAL